MKILVDCNNICWIAHYSQGELSVGDRRTGTVFGFLRQVFSIADTFNSNQFIFCWDSMKSFRKIIFPDYKVKRHTKELTPEEEAERLEVRRQMVELRRYVLPRMGFVNNFRKVGYEADDLIASIIIKNPKDSFCIVSTDNDLWQLLGYDVFAYSPVTKAKMTAKRFKMEYGISHKQWAMAKAIGGCSGDEVPGIKGAGDPKNNPSSKAIKYLRGELTKGIIYERIESAEGRKIINRNLKLIKLPFKNRRDLRINVKRGGKDNFRKAEWVEVFDEYDFRYFMQKEQLEKLEELFGI